MEDDGMIGGLSAAGLVASNLILFIGAVVHNKNVLGSVNFIRRRVHNRSKNNTSKK